jgi:hypothetical protein
MRIEGKPPPFDPKIFLARVGAGKTRAELRKGQIVFDQGDPAAAVFYIQKGKIELRVLSRQGKEAILAILGVDDFFGEGCLPLLRIVERASSASGSILSISNWQLARLRLPVFSTSTRTTSRMVPSE